MKHDFLEVVVGVENHPHFNCVCIFCGKAMATTHEKVYADLKGRPFMDYYCEECKKSLENCN